MKRLICALLCTVLLIACLSGCVSVNINPWMATMTGRGALEPYEIPVPEFTGIWVEFFCEIHYYASESDTVTLEIQPNLRDHVSVRVENGVLHVTSDRARISTGSKTPVLTVYTPTLTRLQIVGAVTFTAHDTIVADSRDFNLAGAGQGTAGLEVGSLNAGLSGAGSFTFSGTADTAELKLAGAGNLDALGLQTRDAQVSLSGAGRVGISCSEFLQVKGDGLGSVEYKGSPKIERDIGGLVSMRQVS